MNAVDPSGLEDYPPTAEGYALQEYYERLERRIIYAYETNPRTSNNKFALKLGRAVNKLKDLGSPNIDLLIDHLSLRPLPNFMKDLNAFGFTDPISDTVGICDGDDDDGTATLLNHESMHLRQTRSFRAVQGILGHWLGNKSNLRALEAPAYAGERPLLDKWHQLEPLNSVVSRRQEFVDGTLDKLNGP